MTSTAGIDIPHSQIATRAAHDLRETLSDGLQDRPDTTFGDIIADVLAHFSAGHRRQDLVDVVMSSDWPD